MRSFIYWRNYHDQNKLNLEKKHREIKKQFIDTHQIECNFSAAIACKRKKNKNYNGFNKFYYYGFIEPLQKIRLQIYYKLY